MRPVIRQSGCHRGKDNPFLFVQCVSFSYKVELEYKIKVVLVGLVGIVQALFYFC